MKTNTILFPSSYFDNKRVDEDLVNEYEAAINTRLWNVIFFDYDKWINTGKLILSKEPEELTRAVQRGWMMKAEQYTAFYSELMKRKVELTTSPSEYEYFHYFPNVYADIKEDTPGMIALPFPEEYDLDEIKKRFSRFMVKDYVKSVKGTEFPRYFTNDVTKTELEEALKIFYKYRGNLLSGGLCFKEYVDLRHYGNKTNEFRVFYVGGEVATVCRNSLQPEYTSEPSKMLIEKYKGLPSVFYTLDFGELTNGEWTILEAGDGSVSGPSYGQDLEAFYRAIYICLNL